MEPDAHIAEVGRLVTLLQMLETGLRAALTLVDPGLYQPWRWEDLQVGRDVPEDAFTDYESLGATIGRYNARVDAAHQLAAGPIVALRDALAHARVVPVGATGYPLRLVKFGKATAAKRIPIERIDDLTEAWFAQNIELVTRAIATVARLMVAVAPRRP